MKDRAEQRDPENHPQRRHQPDRPAADAIHKPHGDESQPDIDSVDHRVLEDGVAGFFKSSFLKQDRQVGSDETPTGPLTENRQQHGYGKGGSDSGLQQVGKGAGLLGQRFLNLLE